MEDETGSIGRLESEALKRKKRLEALKRAKQQPGQEQEQEPMDQSNEDTSLPKPVFRSYLPADEELRKGTVPAAQPEDVDKKVKRALENASDAPVLEELDLVNLAPRKPDWDLKRDVAKKLAKLEKRTQRAIAVLIRDRLMETKQPSDLAMAVGTAGTTGTPWK